MKAEFVIGIGPMAVVITKEEAAQLEETIKMFEVMTQSQPDDWQSLAILKEVYLKLDRTKEMLSTSYRLAHAYTRTDMPGRAAAEFKMILEFDPADIRAERGLAVVKHEFGERAESLEEMGKPGGENELVSDEEKAKRREGLEAEMASVDLWLAERENEEVAAWNGEAILIAPVGLRFLCWFSVKTLSWNLPLRGWLLKRWYSYQQSNRCTVRRELAVVVRQAADVRRMIFAFEMIRVLPRGRGPALRELLPASAGELKAENDEEYGRLYRNHLAGTIGAENLTWLTACSEFAREFREALAAKSLRAGV